MTGRRRLQLGRAVLRHTALKRPPHRREKFPTTAGWIRAQLRELGVRVGRDESYAIQHTLIEGGEIEHVGWYEKHRFGSPTGIMVRLYRARESTLRSRTRSLPAPNHYAEEPWWKHPLFGDQWGIRSFPERLQKWREPAEWSPLWLPEPEESA